MLREAPGPRDAPFGCSACNVEGDPSGTLQVLRVTSDLMGCQVGLRQVHVRVLAAIGIKPGEGSVVAFSTAPPLLQPVVAVNHLQRLIHQLSPAGETGGDRRAAREQHLSYPIQLLAVIRRCASHDRVPTAVEVVVPGPVDVERQAVFNYLCSPWTPQHRREGEHVKHAGAQPQLRAFSGQRHAAVIQPRVTPTRQANRGLVEIEQGLTVLVEPPKVGGALEVVAPLIEQCLGRHAGNSSQEAEAVGEGPRRLPRSGTGPLPSSGDVDQHSEKD